MRLNCYNPSRRQKILQIRFEMKQYLRLFIAIDLPQEIKSLLSSIIRELSMKRIAPLRPVQPGGIHLTLKFLGDVESSRIADIAKEMEQTCAGMKKFKLIMGQCGAFPDWNRPRVVWIGLKGDLELLSSFQQKLEKALEHLGFPAEGRHFAPHLTLARIKDRLTEPEKEIVMQMLSTQPPQPPAEFTVESIKLIRSQLTSSGAIYSLIQETRFSA